MRCPHCAGQIPDRSRFCGICGRQIPADSADSAHRPESGGPHDASASQIGAADGAGSMSLFELPVSRGARIARVVSILALDAVLVGTGVAMILSYLDDRDQRRVTPQSLDGGVVKADVEVLRPTLIRPPGTKVAGVRPGNATPVRPATTRTPPAKRRVSAKPRSPSRTRAGSVPAPAPAPAPTPAPTPATRTASDAGPATQPGAPRDPGTPSSGPGSADLADAGIAGPPPGGPTEEEITLLANRIALVVDRKRSQLQRCYSQAAKVTSPSEPLEGKVVIRFEVMPSGSARSVRTMTNTTNSVQLSNCLQGLVRGWTFPPSSQPIEFAWPFVFKAPK